MKKSFRTCVRWLVILASTFLAAPAFAQVPQDMVYTGRLVDNMGNPLTGNVNLTLRIFDAETLGTQLYNETHLFVPLDAGGGFSVQLGLGSGASGPFGADLFSGVDRWLEVVVGADVLTPRQVLGSVPWALIAQQANKIVRDPNATPRFEDCGNGTVADYKTGLQWETKTGTEGTPIDCRALPCADPHDVNNRYDWSTTSTQPDGAVFTNFLARLNGDPTVVEATAGESTGDPADDPTVCLAHHCDWRLPAIGELRTILIGPDAAPGQALVCGGPPCIDPDFAAVGGPSATAWFYWSSSTIAGSTTEAWTVLTAGGVVANFLKTDVPYARAVRGGSCD